MFVIFSRAGLRIATSMGLVQYDSDSDSEQENELEKTAKSVENQGLPGISEKLLDLYQTGPRIISNDPIFHQGRKRTFDHVDGLWPTHVYLEWLPDEHRMRNFEKVLSEYDNAHSTFRDELGVVHPLHVSISDTLMIPTDDKDKFLEDLSKAYLRSGTVELDLELEEVLLNQTHTRAFVTLAADTQSCEQKAQEHNMTAFDNLKKINDSVVSRFNLPTLPIDAVPHVSIGWYDVSKSQPEPEEQRRGRKKLSFKVRLVFETVKVKIGRDVHSISLV